MGSQLHAMPIPVTVALVLGVTYVLADRFTWLMIRVAPRLGLMDHPDARRIHAQPVPRAGGIAVYVALLAGLWLMAKSGLPRELGSSLLNGRWDACFAAGSALLLVVGLLDDRFDLAPWWKLLAQVGAASIMFFGEGVGIGSLYSWKIPWLLDYAINVAWVVVLINAFNLIDGMDGLCAGLGLISVGILTVLCGVGHTPGDMLLLGVMCIALLAFLRYNFHPAKIFLGDAGSMLIGFFIATAGRVTVGRHAVLAGVLLPLLVGGVPLFDVLLAVWRRSVRRFAHPGDGSQPTRIFGADREHIHHRLLAWGLSQRQAAVLMYALAAVIAVIALGPMLGGNNLFAFSLVGLALIGLVGLRYIAPVEFLESGAGMRALIRRPMPRSLKVVGYFLFDTCVLALSVWLALWLVKRGLNIVTPRRLDLLVGSLFVGCSLLALRFARAHTRRWSRAGIHDYFEAMAWLVCGGILSIGLVSVLLEDISYRMALVHVTALAFSLCGLLIPRSLGSLLQEGVLEAMHHRHRRNRAHPKAALPTLLYGAGDLGELFIYGVRLSPPERWSAFTFVGFLDDDVHVKGRRLQGFRVHGSLDDIQQIAALHGIRCVIITMTKLPHARRVQLLEIAGQLGIEVREWQPELEPRLVRTRTGGDQPDSPVPPANPRKNITTDPTEP